MNNQTDSNILLVVVMILAVALVGAWWYKNNDAESPGANDWNQNQRWDQWNQQQQPPQQQPQTQPPIRRPNGPNLNLDAPKSYQEAVNMARTQNKKLFVMFEMQGCSWCQKMKEETLYDPRVQSALRAYVVYYANKDQESSLARKHNIGGVPAYIVADSNERMEKRGQGFKDVDEFLQWLNGTDRRNPWQRDRSPG